MAWSGVASSLPWDLEANVCTSAAYGGFLKGQHGEVVLNLEYLSEKDVDQVDDDQDR